MSLSREPAGVVGGTSTDEATTALVERGEGCEGGGEGGESVKGGGELRKETQVGVMLPILDLPNHSPSTK